LKTLSPFQGWLTSCTIQGRRAARLPLSTFFRAFGAGGAASRVRQILAQAAQLLACGNSCSGGAASCVRHLLRSGAASRVRKILAQVPPK